MDQKDKHADNVPEVAPVVSTPESVVPIQMPKPDNNVLIIAAAIIMAGSLIAAAIFFSGNKSHPATNLGPSADNLAPVTKADHIRGNLSAQIKIVEFSDTECPFCKQFHPVVKQIFDEYSPTNKVAWVYRHFPIPSLHPKAPHEAEALECASNIGGAPKFWEYLDRIFAVTPANNGLDPAELPKIAAYVQIDVDKFNSCLISGKFKSVVDANIKDGANAGVNGTPSSFLIDKRGTIYPLPGAVPYAQLKQAVETLLAK